MNYEFTDKGKKMTYALMGVGLLAVILGIMTAHGEHGATRIWANILVDSFFFFGIALAATFMIAIQYVAEAAWAVPLKRVYEAVSSFLPISAILLIVVFAAGSLHLHHIYHWMDTEVYDTASPKYDEIIANKHAYLNLPFFWIRTLVFLGILVYFVRKFRSRSLEEDLTGGTEIHFSNMKMSATFLVLLAVMICTSSWDWIMSIDTHWFSTLFAWYTFGGMWISGIITIILITLHLKSKGYLPEVNENHLHDIGKWMFAVSFLWSYLWFSQFMLIWYSNIPEEVTYYINRIENYRWLFFTTFFVNFAIPMVVLIARDTKRNWKYLKVVGIIIFIGHWSDAFLAVMPGSMGEHWHLGLVEIGMFAGFLGLFLNVVLRELTKAPLIVQKHPYLEEALHLHN